MRNIVAVAVVSFGVLLWVGTRADPGDRGERRAVAVGAKAGALPAGAGTDRNLIVAELFTSQGCSSCPPADEFLVELGKRDDVLPLAFHVDYWNYIGWSDPFSSSAWSDRQNDYRRARGFRTYTPQLVVNGRYDAVGSRPGAVDQALARARKEAKPVPLKLSAQRKGARVVVDVATGADNADVLVVVFESGLRTTVSRGENRGRKLNNHFIVRKLERAFSTAKTNKGRVSIDLAPEWKGTLGVAAIVADPKTKAIRGARAVAL